MFRRSVTLAMIAGALAFGAAMYVAGWHAGTAAAQSGPAPSALMVQNPQVMPEMIPLPGPDQGLGQQLMPGQGQECDPVILFYHEGRLYQLMPGPDNRPGMPGSPPEYFPLRPYQGPQIPGLPFGPGPSPSPQGPGFQPVQPRF